jgi:phosphoglycerate dehydrogenase-like enzyme
VAQLEPSFLAQFRAVMAIRERTRLDAACLARFPQCELLLQTGGHAYHLDRAAARSCGIVVALGRDVQTPLRSVRELWAALAIGCLRKLPAAQRSMRDGEWEPFTGRTLAGKRLGLLGAGRHGREVAVIARAFGMEVVAWDRQSLVQGNPHMAAAAAPPPATPASPTAPSSATAADADHPPPIPRVPLETLFAESDVVSVHLRLSDESRGLVSAPLLARMRPGAVLINTARGAIVDEAALVDALRTGPLGAAGLDVFETEPLQRDSPLRTMDNVVLTPHLGWTVQEIFDEFATIAARQLRLYLAGDLPPNEVLDPDTALLDAHIARAIAGSGLRQPY